MNAPRGYAPHEPTSPRLALDGVTWLPMTVIPLGDPQYFSWVRAITLERERLKPWTLVALRGGEAPLIAVKRNLWWRLVTWWLNRARRRERAAIQAQYETAAREFAARRAAGLPLKDGTT